MCYNRIMKSMLKSDFNYNRVVVAASALGLIGLIAMLNVSSPTEIGPFGVLLFFTTLYVVFFGIISLFLQAVQRLAFGRKEPRGKDYLYAAVLAFGPIMLLLARSFGAISIWTISLIIIFLALAEFLVYKRV